ncbi:MAG TPA: two-component system response regulator, partial [Thermoanaerobaculia bacterium]|nr:two-component system response regulator [Thermoanaerobaculia bacterium]
MSHKRILIIDDEDDIREVATITLELGGFDVLSAA